MLENRRLIGNDYLVPPRYKLVFSGWPIACCGRRCRCSYATCTPLFLLSTLLTIGMIAALGDIGYAARPMPRTPTPDYPTDLEYGIHWFTKGNIGMPYVHGGPNPYYNATRRTVLFVHGWAPDSAKQQFRYTFNYYANDPISGPNVDIAAAWIEDGWNVGMFYWNQFGDEFNVNNAEVKIYTPDAPTYQMRWRKNDGSYSTDGSPTVSMTEVLIQKTVQALADFRGAELRIVGHSLGTQLASRLADHLKRNVMTGALPRTLLPERLVLLDPYTSTWATTHRDYRQYNNDKSPAESMLDVVTYLVSNTSVVVGGTSHSTMVPVEQLDTTDLGMITIGATMNEPQWALVSFTYLSPEFCSVFAQGSRHDAAFNIYFWTYAIGAAAETLNHGRIGPGALTTRADVLFGMGLKDQGWKLARGMQTANPADNVYELESFSRITGAWVSFAGLIAIAVCSGVVFLMFCGVSTAGHVHLCRTRCLKPERVAARRRADFPDYVVAVQPYNTLAVNAR